MCIYKAHIRFLYEVFTLNLDTQIYSIIFGVQGFKNNEIKGNEEIREIRNPGNINNNVMQHREIITRKLEKVEGNISKLESLLSRGGNINDFIVLLNQTKDVIQDVKDYVQREPRTSGEN